MMKKEYQAPKMEIVDLKHQACLLSASDCDDGDYCDELGFDASKAAAVAKCPSAAFQFPTVPSRRAARRAANPASCVSANCASSDLRAASRWPSATSA